MPIAASHDILYLIDGHAQMFRSFYAIRNEMTSPVTGEPTNATFAFTGMLIKLFDQFHPRYAVMAIDTPGRTFREELYSDYKANREAPPETFEKQIPRMLEITEQFGIPVIGRTGAEADDLIATITQKILDDPGYRNIQIRIVSKDKDLQQLLGDRVTMFDIHTDTTIDTRWLLDNKGIRPHQVVDMLTLIGDTVDNIPGVTGIGPKTASTLIQQYGSLDHLLENLDRIKGKRRENIEEAKPFLETARKLVTLDRHIDLEFDLDKARIGDIRADAIVRLFKQLGFNRHLNDFNRLVKQANDLKVITDSSDSDAGNDSFLVGLFAADDTKTSGDNVNPAVNIPAQRYDKYRAVTTTREMEELADTLIHRPVISVDTETIGLGHHAELCGISLAWESGSGVYIPIRSPEPDSHLDKQAVFSLIGPVLENPDLPKCGHNLKYDLLVLKNAGLRLRGRLFDTMIAAFLTGSPAKSLDDLALAVFQYDMIPITDLIGPRKRGVVQKTFDTIPLKEATVYAAEDADLTLRLYEHFRTELENQGMQRLAEDVEMPLVEVLAVMEDNGIRVEPDILDQQKTSLNRRIVQLRDSIHEYAGGPFNIDSPRQLADVLFNQLKLPVVKKTRTGPSTDIEVLEKLCDMEGLDQAASMLPPLIIEYRQLTKLVGTYLESLKTSINGHTGRIHATFHQTGTATGRLSSSGPNLQNIPIRTDIGRNIRKAFVAGQDHVLISADYSQIELRILAHLSNDDELIKAFNQDADIHTAVAAEVFCIQPDQVSPQQRSHAKTINFGIIYGVTAYGLARRIEGMDVGEARKLIEDYRRRFSGIDRFLFACVQQALAHGYVTTMLGRRRRIPEINAKSGQARALGERLAINTVVQGSAADLIKRAMVNLYRRIEADNLPMKILLQIHDELVIESPQSFSDEAIAVIRHEMETAMSLKVPLKVDCGIGPDWFNAK